jgi:hypothetical protein
MYPKVYLDLYNVCVSNPARFILQLQPVQTGAKQRVCLTAPTGQGPYQQHIFMTQNSEWRNIITGLRIDSGVSCSSRDDPTYHGEITIER